MDSDSEFQDQMLQGVSRTFALTIPQLPESLREAVGNAYLLCRIADTIEDDPGLNLDEKECFSEQFIEVVNGRSGADEFAAQLSAKLSRHTTEEEHSLIQNAAIAVRITHTFNTRQIQALQRCVRIMSRGMVEFQRRRSLQGLTDMKQLDLYCYYVAGVVGEMLTELFCDYSPQMQDNRQALMELAVSFGQGLQMTNILMDIWDDREKGACWLPRDVFEKQNTELDMQSGHPQDPNFTKAIAELVNIAADHLSNAFRYTLTIPARETGIRKHCLMALAMAVLTLRRIHANPAFTDRRQVKISRRAVYAVALLSKLFAGQDRILKFLFRRYAIRPLTASLNE